MDTWLFSLVLKLLMSSHSTFKSIRGSRSKVLVRVKLEGQLSVGFLQIFIAGILGNTKDLIEVSAILNPVNDIVDVQI